MGRKSYLSYRWVCYCVYLILLMAERLQKYEICKKLFPSSSSVFSNLFCFLWQNEVGAALAEAGEYIFEVFPIYFLKSVMYFCMEIFWRLCIIFFLITLPWLITWWVSFVALSCLCAAVRKHVNMGAGTADRRTLEVS